MDTRTVTIGVDLDEHGDLAVVLPAEFAEGKGHVHGIDDDMELASCARQG